MNICNDNELTKDIFYSDLIDYVLGIFFKYGGANSSQQYMMFCKSPIGIMVNQITWVIHI